MEQTGINVTYNLDELKLLGNEQFVTEMVNLFIKTTSESLINMKNAMENKQWDLVANAAHKMLAPCNHLETKPLVSTLLTIEDNIRTYNKTEEIPLLVMRAVNEANETIKHLEHALKNNCL